ncbi:MAG: sulfite exporter TauE/SafE family protein, partial [Planctomycetaceae bacterium]|nr:sulfite exporter TauE/SafE family protein [Planctomycetaceae bacterium]
GLRSAGFSLWRKNVSGETCGGCLTSPLLMTFLKAPGLHNAFLAGLMTGFLPCGLVYAFLALAAARTNPLEGMAVMTAFGLGTIPLMVLTGIGSTLLSAVTRQRLLRAAAWCVVLTGMLTVVRGAGFLRAASEAETPACPFCAGSTDTLEVPTK